MIKIYAKYFRFCRLYFYFGFIARSSIKLYCKQQFNRVNNGYKISFIIYISFKFFEMKKLKLKLDNILQDKDSPYPSDYLSIPSNKSEKCSEQTNSYALSSLASKRKKSLKSISSGKSSFCQSSKQHSRKSSIEHFLHNEKSSQINSQIRSIKQEALQLQFEQNRTNEIDWNKSSQYSQIFKKLKIGNAIQKDPKLGQQTTQKLKNIVRQNKINSLVANFIHKLRRNNIYSKAIQNTELQFRHSVFKFLDKDGYEMPIQAERYFSLILILSMFAFIYYITLEIIFNISTQQQSSSIKAVITIIHLIDCIINSITIKKTGGHKLTTIKDILKHYYHNHNMVLDIMLMMALIIQIIIGQMALTIIILIMMLFKIPYLIEKLNKLENHFISTIYMEQYWSLLKIFLFNFCYAHVLAILLTLMAKSNEKSNWIIAKNISGNPWYEIYIWAYYWAANIMLTVGFGDIVATNYHEALYLIFIQTISCLVLAYNINNVGSLISNIRAQELEKNKKYNVFRNLINKNQISNDLTLKIQNFIEESNNIKKKFNIEEEHKFIDYLPKVYKKQYLKQSNKSIFKNIFYFRGINQKAIESLAQSIEIYITHPEQTILGGQDYLSLKVLKRGSIGYTAKKAGSKLNNMLIEKINIAEGDLPLIIGLNFILRRRPNYEIKSLQYSILYHLSYDKLISHLKNSTRDYEYFCYLRDKSKYHIDQFQIIKCPYCKYKHNKFDCPKLHYIPFKEHIILKNILKEKGHKNKRSKIERVMIGRHNSLVQFGVIGALFNPTNNSNIMKRTNKMPTSDPFHIVERIINRSSVNEKETIVEKILCNKDDSSLFKSIMNITTEAIKKEMIVNKKKENEEDEVWDLSLDTMQDYKSYFPSNNPSNTFINLSNINSIYDLLNAKAKDRPYDTPEKLKNQYSKLFKQTKMSQMKPSLLSIKNIQHLNNS